MEPSNLQMSHSINKAQQSGKDEGSETGLGATLHWHNYSIFWVVQVRADVDVRERPA